LPSILAALIFSPRGFDTPRFMRHIAASINMAHGYVMLYEVARRNRILLKMQNPRVCARPYVIDG
ncbi:MAG TPA: hypothetical protein VNY06_01555, partial [Methylocella sp.]|nr:hypothetical protein [Methylocella sp.]